MVPMESLEKLGRIDVTLRPVYRSRKQEAGEIAEAFTTRARIEEAQPDIAVPLAKRKVAPPTSRATSRPAKTAHTFSGYRTDTTKPAVATVRRSIACIVLSKPMSNSRSGHIALPPCASPPLLRSRRPLHARRPLAHVGAREAAEPRARLSGPCYACHHTARSHARRLHPTRRGGDSGAGSRRRRRDEARTAQACRGEWCARIIART